MAVEFHPAVAGLTLAVDALASSEPHAVPTAHFIGNLEQLIELQTRLSAELFRYLANAEDRDVTTIECGRATSSWLVDELRMNQREAHRRMRLARTLPAHPVTFTAFRCADISEAHVHVILAALAQAPAQFREGLELALVDLAKEHTPLDVARAVEQILVALGADDTAEARAARRYERRGVDLAETFDGTGSLSGTLASTLREKLAVAFRSLTEPAADDPRTASQRRHDALEEIVDFFNSHADLKDDNGERPRVVVTMTLAELVDHLATRGGMFDSGVAVSPATARRLACDAQIIPAVLGSRGDVIDMGVAVRTFSDRVKRAAKIRDGGGCAYPRCRRRIAECHHIVHWAHGGKSTQDNAAWLCTYHHWLAHEGGWHLKRNGDGSYTWTGPTGRQVTGDPPRHPVAA